MSIKLRSFARGSVILCTGSWSCRLAQCLPPLQPAFQSPAAAEVIAARGCISDQLPPFRRASPPCRRNRRPGQPRMAKGYRCGRLAQLTDSLALCLDDQLGRRTVVTLRGAACQVRQLPVDQVPIPLHVGAETSHSRGSDHLINLFGGQDTSLARRHHLHDVGAQTACCLRQLHTSVVVVSQRLPSLRACLQSF